MVAGSLERSSARRLLAACLAWRSSDCFTAAWNYSSGRLTTLGSPLHADPSAWGLWGSIWQRSSSAPTAATECTAQQLICARPGALGVLCAARARQTDPDFGLGGAGCPGARALVARSAWRAVCRPVVDPVVLHQPSAGSGGRERSDTARVQYRRRAGRAAAGRRLSHCAHAANGQGRNRSVAGLVDLLAQRATAPLRSR